MSPVYWVVLLSTLILGGLAQKNCRTIPLRNGSFCIRPDAVFTVLLMGILILVSGLRYGTGTDFWGYYRWQASDWVQVWKDIIYFQEGGFSLLVKLARSIWDNGQSVILFSACITITLYGLTF